METMDRLSHSNFRKSTSVRRTVVILLIALVGGCGGSSSNSNTNNEPELPPEQTPATPPPPAPPPSAELVFLASFPPEMSRTEDTTVAIVGQLADGIEASSVTARTGDLEVTLSSNTEGEWRGELPLSPGANTISVTVTRTTGDEETLDIAEVSQGVLLGFPSELVTIGDLAYTRDRNRLNRLGLVEIDLTTGVGRRVELNPSIVAPGALLGQVNGGLLVRDSASSFRLIDLEADTSRPVLSLFREMIETPFLFALDESRNRLYAALSSLLLFADVGGFLPVGYSQGAAIEQIGAGSLLTLDSFNQELVFQSSMVSPQGSAPLITIDLESGVRTERFVSFQGAPFTAVEALAQTDGLILVDALGQFFRLDGDSLTAVSLISSPEQQSSVAELVAFDDQWVALDGSRGDLFRVDPTDGSRSTLFSSSQGSGPRSPGWHGLIFDETRDELLGISFLGAQSIDAESGDRSDGISIEFEAISAGPNFIALPPLANGLSLDADGSNLYFARVTNVAMGASDIVRLNLATGESETLASINSQASGTLLPRFPTVITAASRQLAWFFDVDADRSLSRIDLADGTVTDLALSVSDRPLLAVIADELNERLIYATLEEISGVNRLEIIELDDDGQQPQTLASIDVDIDRVSVIDPQIKMALSSVSDLLYVPLPLTERVAVINLTNGEAEIAGEPLRTNGDFDFVRFSTGLSSAAAPDGRLFVVNGDGGIRAIDVASSSEVLLCR